MNTSDVDFKMVDAINQMAQTMGMKTIAEGVENEATWKILQTIGVDFIQGYTIGRPAPLAELWQKASLDTERKVIPLHQNKV